MTFQIRNIGAGKDCKIAITDGLLSIHRMFRRQAGRKNAGHPTIALLQLLPFHMVALMRECNATLGSAGNLIQHIPYIYQKVIFSMVYPLIWHEKCLT